MSNIPYNYKQYLSDVTKMRQRGAISTSEQIASPHSAGSRGLAKLNDFTNSPNQVMKANDVIEDEKQELAHIKKLAGLL